MNGLNNFTAETILNFAFYHKPYACSLYQHSGNELLFMDTDGAKNQLYEEEPSAA